MNERIWSGSSLHVELSITLLPCVHNGADANNEETQNSAQSTLTYADETRTDQERSHPGDKVYSFAPVYQQLCS